MPASTKRPDQNDGLSTASDTELEPTLRYLSSTMEQTVAQVMKLQKDCMEQQGKQSRDLQTQLQSLQVEQASMRSLVKYQHEQILQKLLLPSTAV
mmetsp:Transcript_7997/g.14660  ORF Transcript_7997/g.14660 Transcript_7997/m.14660 type:complete len:95 (+) Transcript_7997:52-336(+)